jgi:hypothetical protein
MRGHSPRAGFPARKPSAGFPARKPSAGFPARNTSSDLGNTNFLKVVRRQARAYAQLINAA